MKNEKWREQIVKREGGRQEERLRRKRGREGGRDTREGRREEGREEEVNRKLSLNVSHDLKVTKYLLQPVKQHRDM